MHPQHAQHQDQAVAQSRPGPEWPRIQGQAASSQDDLRGDALGEVWEYLMHVEDQVPTALGAASPVHGSRYWIVMLLLVMAMTGATIYGISMEIL